MNDIQQTVDRYVSIWNELDSARRRELIAETWVEDGTYRDPLLAGDGHAGINAMTQGTLDQCPGHQLRLTSEIDAVGDRVRFGRALVNVASGETLVAGVDFGQIARDGRLQSITGFLDQAPVLTSGG